MAMAIYSSSIVITIASSDQDRMAFDAWQAVRTTSGWASNQLSYPQSMSFDSDGNIWVADTSNARIQKFVLKNDVGGKCCPVVSVRVLSGDELSSNKSAFTHELSPHWHLYVDMTLIESFSC